MLRLKRVEQELAESNKLMGNDDVRERLAILKRDISAAQKIKQPKRTIQKPTRLTIVDEGMTSLYIAS